MRGANIEMTLPVMIRLAIPLLLVLASATFFFRALLLLVVATVFLAILAFLVRAVGGRKPGATGSDDRSDTGGKRFVEGRAKIVDESDESSG